jgi:hypothetical protein
MTIRAYKVDTKATKIIMQSTITIYPNYNKTSILIKSKILYKIKFISFIENLGLYHIIH